MPRRRPRRRGATCLPRGARRRGRAPGTRARRPSEPAVWAAPELRWFGTDLSRGGGRGEAGRQSACCAAADVADAGPGSGHGRTLLNPRGETFGVLAVRGLPYRGGYHGARDLAVARALLAIATQPRRKDAATASRRARRRTPYLTCFCARQPGPAAQSALCKREPRREADEADTPTTIPALRGSPQPLPTAQPPGHQVGGAAPPLSWIPFGLSAGIDLFAVALIALGGGHLASYLAAAAAHLVAVYVATGFDAGLRGTRRVLAGSLSWLCRPPASRWRCWRSLRPRASLATPHLRSSTRAADGPLSAHKIAEALSPGGAVDGGNRRRRTLAALTSGGRGVEGYCTGWSAPERRWPWTQRWPSRAVEALRRRGSRAVASRGTGTSAPRHWRRAYYLAGAEVGLRTVMLGVRADEARGASPWPEDGALAAARRRHRGWAQMIWRRCIRGRAVDREEVMALPGRGADAGPHRPRDEARSRRTGARCWSRGGNVRHQTETGSLTASRPDSTAPPR